MKVYRTLHDFDGMDEGQALWQAHDDTGRCIAWVVSDGEGADEVAASIKNTIGIMPYEVSMRDDAERFAVMLRNDENVRRMLDEIVGTIAKWWDEDSFVLDADWDAGYEMGRKSVTMPHAPRWRNQHHYEHGAALGMMSNLASITDVDYDFIETWVVPYKAKENPYNVA